MPHVCVATWVVLHNYVVDGDTRMHVTSGGWLSALMDRSECSQAYLAQKCNTHQALFLSQALCKNQIAMQCMCGWSCIYAGALSDMICLVHMFYHKVLFVNGKYMLNKCYVLLR